MIPVLYEINETEFKTNGICRLSQAISCEVTEEKNKKYELELTYPVGGKYFNELKVGRVLYGYHDMSKDAQPFDIYQISKPSNGAVTVSARHISYRLNKYVFTNDLLYFNSTAKMIMADIKGRVVGGCPFTFDSDIEDVLPDTVYVGTGKQRPIPVRDFLGDGEFRMLNAFDGEYLWDKFHVSLLAHRGSDKGVKLRTGKNVSVLTSDVDFTSVITAVIPVWGDDTQKEFMKLPELMVESTEAHNYPYQMTMVYDTTKIFDVRPTEEELRSVAQEYLRRYVYNMKSKISYKVDLAGVPYDDHTFDDLKDVLLCDIVTVQDAKSGVNEKQEVVKVIYDMLAEKYISLEIGTLRRDISYAMRVHNSKTNEQVQANSKRIDAVNIRVDAIDTSIGDINTDIGDINAGIGDINTSIGDINTSIGDINTDIGSIDTGLTGVAPNINSLDNRLTDLENGGGGGSIPDNITGKTFTVGGKESPFGEIVQRLSNDRLYGKWTYDGLDLGTPAETSLPNYDKFFGDGRNYEPGVYVGTNINTPTSISPYLSENGSGHNSLLNSGNLPIFAVGVGGQGTDDMLQVRAKIKEARDNLNPVEVHKVISFLDEFVTIEKHQGGKSQYQGGGREKGTRFIRLGYFADDGVGFPGPSKGLNEEIRGNNKFSQDGKHVQYETRMDYTGRYFTIRAIDKTEPDEYGNTQSMSGLILYSPEDSRYYRIVVKNGQLQAEPAPDTTDCGDYSNI